MKKYKLKNITCASCAARIETELKKLEDVKEASVNFASSTLNIDLNDLQKIRSVVKRVEPGAEVEEFNSKNISIKNSNKTEILKISFVILLFIAGLIFKDDLSNTKFSWAEYLIFITAYLLSGWGVLSKAVKNIIRGRVFDENFLMTLATLGAIAIGELPEAVGVMLFYNIGEFVQGLAVNNSRRSIKALLEIRPDYANLKTGEKINKVSPEEVEVGNIITVKPGEKIPLDGVVVDGSSFVDTFILTGETVPKSARVNDHVLAGMINKSGLISIKVTSSFGESSISKILELVENAGKKKAETEKFITTFARYYTPVVVFIAVAIAILPPLFFSAQTFEDWIYRALVILVISCPCALVVSIPLGYFGGIGSASKKGILIKGSNYLDALTQIKTVVFDKTGTLTKGVFKVTDVVLSNGFSKRDILHYAALAESHSNHPVAKSIAEAYNEKIESASVRTYQEISGQGIKAKVNGKEVIAGNDRLLHTEKIQHEICKVDGTVVHVAVDRKYAGYIIISDELKDGSLKAIRKLKEVGVDETIMLTGDNHYSAKAIADKLGIDKFYAELLPEDKVTHLEKIINNNLSLRTNQRHSAKVAFVGDGINDAPVIARADVGIAMGGLGSDAAVEAADVVILEDDPSKVAEAIIVAKKTRRIVWQNIIFAMGVKAFFIALGGMGLASMWEAVFADMGVAIIAIFNSARMLKN